MRTLVVFYSKTSHTKKVGEWLAKFLKADHDEIFDQKNRKGFWNWLKAGRDAFKKKSTEISFKKDPASYDLVIMGTPVWAWTMTPAIRTYMEQNKSKFKKVAIFCTQGAPNCPQALEKMEELLGHVEAKEDFEAKTIENGTYIQKIEDFAGKLSKIG